jgi:prolyl-tRNA synthetase
MAEEKKLTTRSEDFAEWYNEVVLRSELADYSPVKGSMVIRPWGYGIWENMQRALDAMLKETGHENAYFPLLIPMSFIEREKDHVEGFAPELAVVTQAGGKELEEPFAIRPTSETIIYAMYAKWVQSYRDLPILMNQWANVMRWELRTRLFLRTTEFLWQEGHTAHATAEEAQQEALMILGVYRKFMEEWIALPPMTGRKSDTEKFAGAVSTHTLEALMQDNRALQAGTSHFLGQNFAKQFDLKFQTEDGREDYAWNTSWGVTTRLVGALVMSHGDDAGIVVPPKLAPVQVVIVPILGGAEEATVREKADGVAQQLRAKGVRVKLDGRDNVTAGAKYYEWERKGVPFRVEIGPKDIAKEQVAIVRRVTPEGEKRKAFVPEVQAIDQLPSKLDAFQTELLQAAKHRREENTVRGVKSIDELAEALDGGAGFVLTGWSGDPSVEAEVKERTKATLRAIVDEEFRSATAPAKCVSGRSASIGEVAWARAY